MIKILDDDDWEPDEDFFVELYDETAKTRLLGEDTRTRVTILDDDKPGMLVFKDKKTVKHPAVEANCVVVVERVQGADGQIKVKYETVCIDDSPQTATPGKDYTPVQGQLVFNHNELRKEIVIPILKHEGVDEGAERDEIFGVKLYEPEPAAVKISKKNTLMIEIVTDSEKKKQSEAIN